MKMAEFETGEAKIFINYLNERGGEMVFTEIQKPISYDIRVPLNSWFVAEALQKNTINFLENMHQVAQKYNASEVCFQNPLSHYYLKCLSLFSLKISWT